MADRPALGGRRSPVRVIAGLLVAGVAVFAFVSIDLAGSHRRQVLAVTGDVAAGQRLTASDLVDVAVDVEPGVPTVPAGELADVVGRAAAVPLVRGELLAVRLLGPAAFPPAGQAVLAVDIKAGQAPAGIQPGSTVLVLPAAATADAGSAPAAPTETARVVAVDAAADGSGDQVVSLLMAEDAAVAVGPAAGSVCLILVGAPK